MMRSIIIPQKKYETARERITFPNEADESTSIVSEVYKVFLEQDEDGRFVATCPDLQGVVTDGATEREALKNVHEAIEAMLEARGLNKEFNLIAFLKK